MRDKYANKSPIMRIFHKYTGLIIIGSILLIATPIIMDYQSKQVFFETWSCEKINHWLLANGNFPPHHKLTDKEHDRLHEILKSCGNLPTHK